MVVVNLLGVVADLLVVANLLGVTADLLVVVNLPGVVADLLVVANLLGVTAVVGWVWSVYKTGTVGSFQVHIRRKSTA